MKRGRFITLEGGEGAGKSTHARMLAVSLAARGLAVELTREPGGTPGAEAVRTLLLDAAGEGWGAEAEALLFAAARADHVQKRIDPALDRGTWVICDRFLDSTRAYQGGGGGLSDEEILQLHRIGSGGLLPDLTLLLQVPAETAAARLARRDGTLTDAISGRDAAFHARVATAFEAMADAEPARFRRIAGDAPLEDVHMQILRAIEPLLEAKA